VVLVVSAERLISGVAFFPLIYCKLLPSAGHGSLAGKQ
jgi:hypothetical protein